LFVVAHLLWLICCWLRPVVDMCISRILRSCSRSFELRTCKSTFCTGLVSSLSALSRNSSMNFSIIVLKSCIEPIILFETAPQHSQS
jgi:hypothetical protein